MADTGATTLALADANDLLVEGAGVRFAAEPGLGIAKLQILAADPDGWFETALGIAAPPVLGEIQPGPVAIAWLAPGARPFRTPDFSSAAGPTVPASPVSG